MKNSYAQITIAMMLLAAILFVSACSDDSRSVYIKDNTVSLIDSLKKITPEQRAVLYGKLKEQISAKQQELASQSSVEKAREYLSKALVDSIFHYWYETPWDFNGTTEMPQQGSIACGFFISTTLQHAGFNIDRVRCGQQASSVFINIMCEKRSIKWISNKDMVKLVDHLLKQPDGLYLIGLDYHTGFIQKDGNDLWMIHAAFHPHRKVVKERVQESAHIKESNIFMIGNLLGNDELVRKWMTKERIVID